MQLNLPDRGRIAHGVAFACVTLALLATSSPHDPAPDPNLPVARYSATCSGYLELQSNAPAQRVRVRVTSHDDVAQPESNSIITAETGVHLLFSGTVVQPPSPGDAADASAQSDAADASAQSDGADASTQSASADASAQSDGADASTQSASADADAGVVQAPPFVVVQYNSAALAPASGQLQVVTQFTTQATLLSEACPEPAGDVCEFEIDLSFSRADGGARRGSVRVNWQLAFAVSLVDPRGQGGPLALPWDIEVVQP